MLSFITISALRFATFCLFVETALVILKNKEEIRESIIDEIKNQLPDNV